MSVIGWVDYPDGRRATLNSDGSWTIPDRRWAEEGFKLIYSDTYQGPADGVFGPKQLAELAELEGGTVHLVESKGDSEHHDGLLIY